MKSDKPRPTFKTVKPATAYASPEELFYKLSRREKTHGYLRGPQQDVLREYAEKHAGSRDVAFELPTGTGKTAVGLLVAEWKRLQSSKAAYLSLTNQLAGQVLNEAKQLGISCADLRGTKETRDPSAVGRYTTGEAIAVTTYSNLFNIDPVLKECDLFVFDDAHGAEHYVTDMWSVRTGEDKALYDSLLAALRPALSDTQILMILDKSAFGGVEMADVRGHQECTSAVIDVLDNARINSARYAWKLIRNKVNSCLFLVSPNEIVVRPLIPPTHTHDHFNSAKQRIYMSATLGGQSDLQRAYGVEKLHMVRAKSPQWGRRYVFVPGIYTASNDAVRVVASVWDGMKTRRAVLLAPSRPVLNRTFDSFESTMNIKPTRVGAVDIEKTMDPFINNTDVILGLSRYDGLDLPDEQCRLLILSDSPAAINQLERHLGERWKMGPVLKKRERTRLIQGMGRCTRNATDFAVIIWIGQSLVKAATSSSMLNGFPSELAAEVSWGVQQSELAADNPDQLVTMILSLIEDVDYRKEADASIEEIESQQPDTHLRDYEEAGEDEVRYSAAMWEGNYEYALETAHRIADQLNSRELAGYRAWWWYLKSIAAALNGDNLAGVVLNVM